MQGEGDGIAWAWTTPVHDYSLQRGPESKTGLAVFLAVLEQQNLLSMIGPF